MKPGDVRIKPTELYSSLLTVFGPQDWWPARTGFEVAVGAILTQQTSWKNVEKAIRELRRKKLLTAKKLAIAKQPAIESCIRPAGFYKQKARRIRLLAQEFPRIRESAKKLKLPELRTELLELDGVGKETADSVLLYAFDFPILPIDAYTHRITQRIYGFDGDYEELRLFYESRLPRDPSILNEFHALLVELAKRNCWKKGPDCQSCPVMGECKPAGSKLK